MKKNQIMKVLSTLFILYYSTFLNASPSTEKIKSYVQSIMPDVQIDEVKETPIKGLYSVAVGPRIIYFSEDMRYMIQGNILDVATMENLTEVDETAAIVKSIDNLDEKEMIIYPAKDKIKEKTQDTVTVFTDIDCGYCRKLHSKMDDYNKLGINIRYLFYPRAGKNSNSYKKAVSVWCADDKVKAMNEAKSGKKVIAKNCENPISKQMKLANMLGVNGTPSMVLASGRLIPGYVPPNELKRILAKERVVKVHQQSIKLTQKTTNAK